MLIEFDSVRSSSLRNLEQWTQMIGIVPDHPMARSRSHSHRVMLIRLCHDNSSQPLSFVTRSYTRNLSLRFSVSCCRIYYHTLYHRQGCFKVVLVVFKRLSRPYIGQFLFYFLKAFLRDSSQPLVSFLRHVGKWTPQQMRNNQSLSNGKSRGLESPTFITGLLKIPSS